MNSEHGTKVLVRKRDGRMVAGVCAGLADYFGSDVTLIRVIVAALAVFTGGAGILAYLVAWAIIRQVAHLLWSGHERKCASAAAGAGRLV
jgi:phage shock protein C